MSNPFATPDEDSPRIPGSGRPSISAAVNEFEMTQRVAGWLFLCFVGFGCIAVNMAVPSVLDNLEDQVFSGLLLGCCIAQVNLISIWGVMASGRLLLRLPWAFALITIMWYSLVIGCYFENSNFRMEEALQLGAVLLLSLPLAMAPLGFMAWVFKWKLTRPSKDNVREQMSVGLLLAGITLVAILLGLGRVILPDSPVRFANLQSELYFLLAAVVVFNLMQTTPAIWVTFLPPQVAGFSVIGIVLYAMVLAIAEVFTISAFLGMPPDFWEITLVFAAMNVAQVLTVVMVLFCLRLLGFVLNRNAALADSPFAAEISQTQTNPFQVDYQPTGAADDVNNLFCGMESEP